MNTTHANKITSKRLNMMTKMKRQKRDINIFPFQRLNQIQQSLKQFDRQILIGGKNQDLLL
jgi:hypothetical protein